MSEQKILRILCFGDSLTEGYSMYGTSFTPYGGTLKSVLGWELGREVGGRSDGVVGEGDGDEKEKMGKEGWTVEVVTEGVSGEMVRDMGRRMEGIYSKFDKPSTENDSPSTPTSSSSTSATPSKPFDLVIFLGGTNDLGRCRPALEILYDIKTILDISLATGAKVLLMTVPETGTRVGWLEERRGVVNSGLKAWAGTRDDMEIFDLCEAVPYHTMEKADREHIWDDGVHFKEAGYEVIGTLVGKRIVEILGEKPGWLG